MSTDSGAGEPERKTDVPGAALINSLSGIALDMRSTWNHSADEIWNRLEPDLWDLTNNPWIVLQSVSRQKLRRLLADPVLRDTIEALVRERREYKSGSAWFQQNFARAPFNSVAYFSMEFMLSEALPIYSGGLGNVAGDQLKAASDLGVPVIGVGLLYNQGYFRQVIDQDGSQKALFPYNDPGQLPIAPLRRKDGEWLRLEIDLPGRPIRLRTWQVQVGRTMLFLLDSNDMANFPPYRGITSELYAGEPYQRLMQEIVLGIGGWRLLTALGIHPEILHLNEGHAALAVLERARAFMADTGLPFDVALTATRAGNIFTTHTAVGAAFDRFSPDLVELCLGGYAREKLGLQLRDFLALGRRDPDNRSEEFNMAFLAVRGSGAANGVSRLHSAVSRRIFAPLFPRWPYSEVPVGYVTNGVHMPSWDSAPADRLWTEACGKDRWLGSTAPLEQCVRGISDADLWGLRTESRKSLVEYVRKRLARQLVVTGASAAEIESAGRVLDPDVLTLGFARRFASYKRPDLLLHDRERLVRILNNDRRPAQLVLAGKAHPADRLGQDMIREWNEFIKMPDVRGRIVFLSDYDMLLTERLVEGVDVWINTPRRPWEASGTSGMKVLVNGGINLSELDGWWAEAYSPAVGWAVGDGKEHGDDPGWDAAEADFIYGLLEGEIANDFYSRGGNGIPKAWVARMRESMALLTPRFSSNRVVREYTEQYYIPAAAAWRKRAANNGKMAMKLVEWRRDCESKWAGIGFGPVSVETGAGRHRFGVQVFLERLDPKLARVELYADGADGNAPVRQAMKRIRNLEGAPGGYVYSASVPADRPAADYTPRVIPYCQNASVPLEAALIRWQK